MITLAKFAFVLLLFIFCYVSVHGAMSLLFAYSSKRSRLSYRQQRTFQFDQWLVNKSKLYRHLSDLLESVQWPMKAKMFLLICVILMLVGLMFGAIFFGSLKGLFGATVMLGGLPYLLLRMKLVAVQMKNRMEFLPAIEIFYQSYVLEHSRNLRVVLREVLKEDRLSYPIRPVFEQLERHLSTKRDPEDSLRIFNLTLGHEWARYFSNIFSIGFSEGVDVTENLKELIMDMRKAQLSDQVERNRLLEIRIANFSPLFFLGVFLFINYQLNKELAVQYYFWSYEGRELLLDALLLIFLSFLMGIYLSIKRM